MSSAPAAEALPELASQQSLDAGAAPTDAPLPSTAAEASGRNNNGANDAAEEQWTLRYIYPTAGAKPANAQANSIPIVTQDSNGPCSLVALSNILLLRGILAISPADRPAVDFTYLSRSLAELFLTKPCPEDQDEGNWQTTLSQALDILPTTRHGLDVNVDFRDAAAFHPPNSPQLALFRLFGIRLVHGWLPDPADRPTFEALVPSSTAPASSEASSSSQNPASPSLEQWRTGSDYDAVIQRLVAAQDIAGNFADLDIRLNGRGVEAVQGPDASKRNVETANSSGGTVQPPAPDGDSQIAVDPIVQKLAESSLSDSTEQPLQDADKLPTQSLNPFLPQPTAEPKSKSKKTEAEAEVEAAAQTKEEKPETSGPESWTDEQRRTIGDAIHIRTFLESNPTQLSIYGLFSLASTLQPGELCALFRNMHLSCLYRRREDEGVVPTSNIDAPTDGPSSSQAVPRLRAQEETTPHLFTLVTDEFLAREHPRIVWESLEDVHGSAGAFYDANFHRVHIKSRRRSRIIAGQGQGDRNDLVSRNTQVPDGFWDPVVPGSESEAHAGGSGGRSGGGRLLGMEENDEEEQHDMDPSSDADYALAYQLQQEEQQAAQEADRARQYEHGTSASSSSGPPAYQQTPAEAALAGAHEDLGRPGDSRRNKMMKKRQSGSGKKDEKCAVM
ncbi:unnamed protein product [Tilletia controversa]|uniref:MINDY deubiquitinase domain-containing protein n=3 Tax=Tilletia TaxID=13289 RepID=A0A8X7SWQ2_9BASI|nr:hypothetical protein CF336_g5841 [Tilletia laevis]KAE8190728.1 hypothetical protein CF328_g5884 [Tilletia controversa]KAE8254504.1 hypothetical protein A4X03_0g5706 [Tilletia caries]KAE8194786.1 hypothetical protein CF335_g5254 [Tilletia laevis]KAE8247248.1 hypothetical protein A4X06_0g4590 [Tilletia controversa]